MARAFMKISSTLTPLGQLAAHDPHRRHLFNRWPACAGWRSISRARPSSRANLPRATSDSRPVSANTGQTDWHRPQRIQTMVWSSSSLTSAASCFRSGMWINSRRFYVSKTRFSRRGAETRRKPVIYPATPEKPKGLCILKPKTAFRTKVRPNLIFAVLCASGRRAALPATLIINGGSRDAWFRHCVWP